MIAATLPRTPPRRVLLIKPSALGDVVTALPVLRGLRRTFPEAHIAWLISDKCAPLVRSDSQLDEVVLFERSRIGKLWRSISAVRAAGRLLSRLRGGKYDWVIDLQGLLRSGLFAAATGAHVRAGFADARERAHAFYTDKVGSTATHTVDRNIAVARHLGIDASPRDMRLEVSVGGLDFAESFCKTHKFRRGDFLVCAPSTTWATKMYPVRHWRKAAEAISSRTPVVLIAGPKERDRSGQIAEGLEPGVIDLAGKTTVDEMVALVAASGGALCSDSAVKFIAPAVGVDCITLIGPTQADRTGPYLRGRATVPDLPCQGCLRRRCAHITCMQMIEPAEVISAAEEMLNGRRN